MTRSGAEQATPKSKSTRARIIAAAGRVLAEQGYENTTLTAIADEAGLRGASLYYYFDSRDQLVEEALGWGISHIHERVRGALDHLPAAADPRERLFTAIRAFIEARLEIGSVSPAHIRNYRNLPEAVRRRLRPELTEFSELWDRLVVQAQEAGAVREDIDPFDLHLFIVYTSEQLSRWPRRPRRSTADDIDTIFRLMTGALTATTRPEAT
ncbi:TetR/AcrR family transcriptional regulator [Gordonia sp. (in: high G+C Gram-positive bacteria)]|uniref:TetR/AcrR family transcriptional regulator n=1 Tax=Gordonia sp. (in: high G+C Gram-positive bacteria) TaxID=84139 RepID=UPI0039E36A00